MKHFDAVVVGAGFSGLYMLHRLREQGLTVRVYEAGTDVGGVWYWNRYPGARCDVESVYYNYTFSEALTQEWTWTSRYPDQPSILRYLNHVADRFHLRSDIQFNTRVKSAHYDEQGGRWLVSTEDGETVSATWFISGVGCLSSSNTPDFKGLSSFTGEHYHTGAWPHQPVDFSGKRVGVIGTGSSGIQAIPVIAGQAQHVYVFQRTPQYTTPAQNHPYDDAYIQETKANFPAIKAKLLKSWAGTNIRPAPDRVTLSDTPEERLRRYEAAWQEGGWMNTGYKDLMFSAEANETLCEFVRGKIRTLVKDPQTADKLMPSYVFGSKRPVIDTHYYATYNRDNVTLVDVKAAPIEEITPRGLRTAQAGYELDAIVFATGYDAITGPLFRIDIRGRNGVALKDKWEGGRQIRTYLGLANAGFPNFFMITGPQSPSVLTNMVLSIEQHVEWIADCIRYLRENAIGSIEATPASEADWSQHVRTVADSTLFPRGESWYNGTNIEGKTMPFPIYVGGIPAYREICTKVANSGYEGFMLTPVPAETA